MNNQLSTSMLPIALLGAPVIRLTAKPVVDVSSKTTQELIDQLIETCLQAQGVGIAAPQASHSIRLFIMLSHPNERYPDAPHMEPTAVINPEITWKSNEQEKGWEGCLSLPGIRAQVPRATKLESTYISRTGETVTATYEGFLARLFQHEYDHLNGVVFIDRVESTQDVVMEEEYRRIIACD